jgi:hypothetical protein
MPTITLNDCLTELNHVLEHWTPGLCNAKAWNARNIRLLSFAEALEKQQQKTKQQRMEFEQWLQYTDLFVAPKSTATTAVCSSCQLPAAPGLCAKTEPRANAQAANSGAFGDALNHSRPPKNPATASAADASNSDCACKRFRNPNAQISGGTPSAEDDCSIS